MNREYEGGIALDFDRFVFRKDTNVVRLGRKALPVLRCLVDAHPNVMSRAQLEEAAQMGPAGAANRIDNLVGRLREYFGAASIRVVEGVGFAWDPRPLWRERVNPHGTQRVHHREELVRAYIDQRLPEGHKGIRLQGRLVADVRTAKRVALSARRELEARYGFDKAADLWRRRTAASQHGASGTPPALNRVAFYLAEALQLLGLACYTGEVSLSRVLVNLGDALVDDWYVCEGWVSTYRSAQETLGLGRREDAAYHRRHAEWLALASALFMYEKWTYATAGSLLRLWGGIGSAREKLRVLTDVDSYVLDPHARDDLRVLSLGEDPAA